MMQILSAQRIARSYGARRVLSDATFSLHAGEVAGLIGPNGAGKTTLLRILVGLLRADSGSVWTLQDNEAESQSIRIAYFAGESTVPPTVREKRWRSLFHDVDRRIPNRPVRLLSRGTRQLFGLRTVLSVPGCRLIVLDEPWEGLDPDAARWLSETLEARRGEGAAVLVSSHRLHDLAGVCDRYIFLHCGKTTSVETEELEGAGGVTGESLLAAFDRIRGEARC